tara:strand:+ start:5521 stop:5898 length:378 start_codon:yes stop_codon:yes gene_type:complete
MNTPKQNSDIKLQGKKGQFLEALTKALGIVTTASRMSGISRQSHYRWLSDDNDYRAAVSDIDNMVLDFGESSLHTLVGENNVAATIFLLKTKGKGRGYVERSDINIGTAERIKIDIMPFDEESED